MAAKARAATARKSTNENGRRQTVSTSTPTADESTRTKAAQRKQETVVLALLQNPYFNPGTPTQIIERYREDDRYRRMVLELTKTGKILRRILGDLYDRIIFNNANPNHGWTREHRERPDVVHIRALLMKHNPNHVICFGGMAATGVELALADFYGNPWVHCFPHPQARGLTNKAWDEMGRRIIAECR